MKTRISLLIIVIVALLALSSYAETSQQAASTVKPENLSVATFAGGCFWCTESDFEKLPGVHEVISGFSGGHVANPSYEDVSKGTTGHVESVQVYYDPNVISYETLLNAFWRMVNPTDNDGQFVDRGKQYRTLIFYHTEEQKAEAEHSRQLLPKSESLKLFIQPKNIIRIITKRTPSVINTIALTQAGINIWKKYGVKIYI
jgi:peptide methionine sulfoxide reductase msrA/msrB